MLRRFTKKAYIALASSPARLSLGLLCLGVFLYCSVFVIPIRNVVLQYYVHKAWTNVSTSDIVKMRYIRPYCPPEIYAKVECTERWKPIIARDDINTSRFLRSKSHEDTKVIISALSRGHGRYLSFMGIKQKLDYVYMFLTMREILDNHKIEFFMTAGSILGATRHGGFIPWDDDLDFAVDFNQWQDVKQYLSCVEGFELEIFSKFHWKFHYENSTFPFIDIFLYAKNGEYLYSMSHYITKTFIYPEDLVFPLVEVEFEGIQMPMPGHGLEIVQRIYEFSQCVAYRGHVEVSRTYINEYPEGYSKTQVPCKDLIYMHNMKNID